MTLCEKTIEEIYPKLLEEIINNKIHIKTDVCMYEVGYYCKDTKINNNNPTIVIKRKNAMSGDNRWIDNIQKIPDFITHCKEECITTLKDELIIVAHEYGHYLSDENTYRDEFYDSSIKKFHAKNNLTTEEEKSIFDEEKRAWNYAKEKLKELGFTDFDSFKKMEYEALEIYKDKFTQLK